MPVYPVEVKIKVKSLAALDVALAYLEKRKELNPCIKVEIEVELKGV